MRLLENQRVKYVQSLYGVLTTTGEGYSSLQDLKAISMFPTYSGELASVQSVFEDMVQEKGNEPRRPVRKRQGILQFFQF
jgi:hypothetical protein